MSLTPRSQRARSRARSNRRNEAKRNAQAGLRFERLEDRLVMAGLACDPLNGLSGGDPALPAVEVAPLNEASPAGQETTMTADPLSKGGTFVGTVKEVDGDDMRIRVQKGEGGRARTFKTDSNTEVVDRNGDAVKLDEIEGARVRVDFGRNGRAIKITVLGRLMAGAPAALPGSEGPVQLPLDNGAISNPLEDVVAGDPLAPNSDFVGTVKAVDGQGRSIRVQKGEGGQARTFRTDSNTEVVDRNGDAVKLDEIEGARVRVEVGRNGRAVKITVLGRLMAGAPAALPGSEGPVQLPLDNGAISNPSGNVVAGDPLAPNSDFVGTVKAVDGQGRSIRVQKGEGGQARTFRTDSNTEVVDRNGDAVKLDEIEGARVRVEVGRNGRAVKITVLGRLMVGGKSTMPGNDGLGLPLVDVIGEGLVRFDPVAVDQVFAGSWL